MTSPSTLDPATADATSVGLQSLFAPTGIIVVGASADPDKLGGAMAGQIGTFDGPVGLVNQRDTPGTHRSVAAAAAAVGARGSTADLAVLCVPAAACADAVRECADSGVRAALICAGGFAEIGPAGAHHHQSLVQAVRDTGIRLLGPNTSGFFAPGRRLLASFVPGVSDLSTGRVAVVAASGGLNHALAFALSRNEVGVSLGVGIGAGIDVTAVDVLHYLADDPTTSAIALHLENVADGPGLLQAVRRITERKPLVALVVGRHDVGAFAQSHTGALATSWRTTRALLRQAGAVLVDRADDLVVAAAALSQVRLSPGANGVGLITAQAGPGLLIADALQDAGITLPTLTASTRHRLSKLLPPLTFQENPVDTGRPGAHYADVIAAVAEDPAVDIVALYGLLEPVVDLPSAAEATVAAGHPVVLGVDGTLSGVGHTTRRSDRSGLPVTIGAQGLACAITAIVQDAQRPRVAAHPTQASPALELGAGPWNESQAKDVLDRCGIPTPRRRLCHHRNDAKAALQELGGRVVMKICDAAIVHKTELGGVFVGVTDDAGVDRAWDALSRLGGSILVEAMAPAGVDLIVGARRDPVFGVVALVGIGGIATEIYADVAIASIPADREHLRSLPDTLGGRALLDGFRGGPTIDRSLVAETLAQLGNLLLINDHLDEVEINPLRCSSDGIIALDAVIIVRQECAT